MNQTCETCRFSKVIWRKGDAHEWVSEYIGPTRSKRVADNVECRRRAPVMAPHERSYDGWPVVGGLSDWCGEYQEALK